MQKYGIKHFSYGCIAESGKNSATLHYEDNYEIIENNSLVLLDMGCAISQYVYDITITIPENGKYSATQQNVYNGVLKAIRMVKSKLKTGIEWPKKHMLAEEIILESFKEIGLAKEMQKKWLKKE